MISRRRFLKNSSLAAGAAMLPGLNSCSGAHPLVGNIHTPNFKLGHTLRGMGTQTLTEFLNTDVVIVGGGVAGLSAARKLKQAGVDFMLLELEPEVGGNSRAMSSALGPHPLGAHYLPLPNVEDIPLMDFLQEAGVITGYKNGKPLYNEYHLCFDPKERLFINHHWQEGLIPQEGLTQSHRDEIQRFLHLMNDFKHALGADGKYAFSIPVDSSSADQAFRKLDTISMAQYLESQQFKSPYLIWYVNYCCLDDFGAGTAEVSAWAGIHYFASRKGVAANAEYDDVLTWPEGNHWLVKKLREPLGESIKSNCLVASVKMEGANVLVDFLDASKGELTRVVCKSAIMATPQFVNKYIVKESRTIDYAQFQYAPWMVANLITSATLAEKRGEPLCWDNVIYGSASLGYVFAGHQSVAMPSGKSVLTYYRPLAGATASPRAKMNDVTWKDWSDSIFEDLKAAHPDLRKQTEGLDIYLWGHGMIKPAPNFIWSENRRQSAQTVQNKIYFVHSDTSGISVFEEAFSNGYKTAESILKS